MPLRRSRLVSSNRPIGDRRGIYSRVVAEMEIGPAGDGPSGSEESRQIIFGRDGWDANAICRVSGSFRLRS